MSRREDALVREWAGYAATIAREFFHPRIEPDDLRQEALIAVMEAARAFDPKVGVPFKLFAGRLVRYRVMETITKANRMKRDFRLEDRREAVGEDGSVLTMIDLLPALNADPHESLLHREELARMARGMGSLSPVERHWLVYAINGGEYSSAVNGRRNKRAENAVDRARKKLMEAA